MELEIEKELEEEVAKGLLLRVEESESLFGESPKTEYVFRNYDGKKLALKINTHVGYDRNKARRGDVIVINRFFNREFSDEFVRVDVRGKYAYVCPSSDIELR